MLFRWKDDTTWKRFVRLANEGNLDAILDVLGEFSEFAVYHGCRPDDPNLYYDQGIRIADVDALNRRAEQIFLTPEFRNLTIAKFQQAIDEDSRIHDGKLFVVLDDEDFMEFSAHYLIYGSEHLLKLANRLNGRGMVRPEVLKRFGIPTLFEIHIPTHGLPLDQLPKLAKHMHRVCGDRDVDQRPVLDWSFIFEQGIPGEWIKAHWHPEEIIDRTKLWPTVYRYKQDKDESLT